MPSQIARNARFWLLILPPLLLLALAIFIAPSAGQENRISGTVNVTIDVAKVKNYVAPRAMGIHVSVYDNGLSHPQLHEMLRAAGITTLRYPGGGYADLYHWSTHKLTKWRGTDPPEFGYLGPNTDLGHFLQLVDRLHGTAIFTVNYGSNLNGTGGGEPAEAAAWVAYTNGDLSDTKIIGKDSTGYDWQTVGYWASLRSSAPLPADDGRNFLRIAHPTPFQILYWEIGNEVFGNGYYGGEGMEEDLHAPYAKESKESAKLREHNPKLSPEAYGKNVTEFSRAMKAVDPKIKIGAVLHGFLAKDTWMDDWVWDPATRQWVERIRSTQTTIEWIRDPVTGQLMSRTRSPQTGDTALEWDSRVMEEAGRSIDFVITHWYAGNLQPPDWKVFNEASYLSAPQRELPIFTKGLLDLFQKYAGDRANQIQLTVTEMGSRPFAKRLETSSDGLFAPDAYLSLMENGAANIDWLELHKPSFLGEKDQKPGPVYFGLQLINRLVHINAALVDARSSHSLLAVHAVFRGNGSLGLMFINKDPKNAANVRVKITGGTFSPDGTRFDFDPRNLPQGYVIPGAPAAGLGNSFSISIPAYSVTDVTLPKGQ
jgi:hypothetical protein